MEKGTGVVKITPAHDFNDFEVGTRHNLPLVRCFTYDGKLTGKADRDEYLALKESGKLTADEPEVLDCGKYAGLTTAEARKVMVADLEAIGALSRIEQRKHEVGTCYRCHTNIEPMISKQWFVAMEELAAPAIKKVEDKELRFYPERFTKIYLNWMRGSRDWCISRQLWWGHRIPAWYCADCGHINVAKSAPGCCEKCGCTHLEQDPDTLDTWFSSALWPFSILGWPDTEAEDYKYFYPTNTLVTGYDIIGFWVSRMIFSGIAYTGKLPFDTVVIHGIVRDSLGRKMSKSLGNGVDPVKVIDEYGADALRFMLVQGSSLGNDIRYSDDKIIAVRNFTNKVWNASRFLLNKLTIDSFGLPEEKDLTLEDKWILTRLNNIISELTVNMEGYNFGVAAQKIYEFIWNVFCDWYIELAKIRLNSDDEIQQTNVQKVLCHVLVNLLKLLHPFMPFITEEIYQALPFAEGFLMEQSWPVADEALNYNTEATTMENIMDLIKAIRETRAELKVPSSKRVCVTVAAADPAAFAGVEDYLTRLASASSVVLTAEEPADTNGMANVVTANAKAYLPLAEMVDIEAEKTRIQNELKNAHKVLEMAQTKLNNPGFVAKAPEKVINDMREKEKKALELVRQLEELYASL